MNVNHESYDSSRDKPTGNELSLPDFMRLNVDHDPNWFVEPENSDDYGPPGMPTPLSPMDPRIADRQLRISANLREILDIRHLPVAIDPNLVDMLQLNYDSYNSILGINNNTSFLNWKDSQEARQISPNLRQILDRAVPGIATQNEIMDLKVGATELWNIETFRFYHAFKVRMRHLQYRRDELDSVILNHGGTLTSDLDYYDLQLSPHYTFHDIEGLSVEEQSELELLELSIRQKYKIIFEHGYGRGRTDAIHHEQFTPEVHQAILAKIEEDEIRKSEISAKSQTNTVVGLMGSIKRRVGVTPINEDLNVNTTERQLFAIDLQQMDNQFRRGIEYVHSRKPVDANSLPIYKQVYEEFMNSSDLIIPVSTTAYHYNAEKNKPVPDNFARILARIAMS